MAEDTLIWPSKLHHLCLTTGQRPEMIAWYRDTMGLTPEDTGDDMTWMKGSQRNLLLQDGEAGEAAFIGLAVADSDHLERLRAHIQAKGITADPLTSPLFQDGSFTITDPDGHRVLFGLSENSSGAPDPRPGCLQHAVFATT
ncbi:MAG: VOC family protein, partial [Rhodospirillales bacterium]|nr:VOC family protein [Rhodospirillales bacterium]